MSNPTDTTHDPIGYLTLLVEQVLDQNRAVLDVVSDMQGKVARIPMIEEKVDELQVDMKTVKFAVTETNRDLHKLDKRVDRLETTVYGKVTA